MLRCRRASASRSTPSWFSTTDKPGPLAIAAVVVDPEVTALKGVGPRVAARLARLGIHRVSDLLLHLPLRYQDRTRLTAIGAARAGEHVVVEGTVEHTAVVARRRRSLVSRISDGTGALTLRFFHFNTGQQQLLARGRKVRCFGELRAGPAGPELIHPEVQTTLDEEPATHLTAFYPATEGLHQLTLRRLVDQALEWYEQGRLAFPELLPAPLLEGQGLPALGEALYQIHRPSADGADVQALEMRTHPAIRRLAFEELLAHNLNLRSTREQAKAFAAPRIAGSGELIERFLRALDFELTTAQRRVHQEIRADLDTDTPMLRLVQGDVGSGKTVVAALAVLAAIESGYQAAIMAPTELLAEQHFMSFSAWLQPLGVELAWVSGKTSTRQRNAALQALASGTAAVAVGTHALFQAEVDFERLGLVIIDEQHRFGVHQRLALREKGTGDGLHPHQLIMTATPIPRTLAMTAYADLDTSVIDELPPGRTAVQTAVIPETRRGEVIERISEACGDARQAYWVCTLVEESEVLQCQAAEQTAESLHEALPALSIGLVHGRMKSDAKERVMSAFKGGDIDLLVATTVIEVGVDVPNASLMVIENAERLGLAQLHQLRGRVGRGSRESSCLLVYRAPLGDAARQRLQIMRETSDGFVIAQKDLQMRGPGEVLGTRQAGQLEFRIADLGRDEDLVDLVTRSAAGLQGDSALTVQLAARWLQGAGSYVNV